MSTRAPVPAPRARSWWSHVNVGTVVGSTIAGGLFGYISNVWIMAVRSDGFNVKSGSAATGRGNLVQGSMFWLLAPTVVFGIAGYWRAVGSKRFFFEMRRLPRLLLTLGRSSGATFQVQFLIGALVGVVASVWIGPSLGVLFSVGFMAMLPTPASSILSSAGYKITQFVASKVTRPPGTASSPAVPSAAVSSEGAGLMSSVVALFGSAAALLVGFFLNSTSVKWGLAAALVLLIVLRSSKMRAAPLALILVFVGLVGVGLLVSSGVARADDGGWSECSGQSWWSCPGSNTVRGYAAIGGALAAVGGAAGGILGGAIGGWPGGSILDDPEFLSPDDPGNELDQTDADEWIRGALDEPEFDDWAKTHPPSEPLSPEDFDDYMTWRHDQGLDDPPLPESEGGEDEPGPAKPEEQGEQEEPSGVTTDEGVAEPVDKFEGSEGFSGDATDDFDDLDDLFTEEDEAGIFADDLLDELMNEGAPEEPGGEGAAEEGAEGEDEDRDTSRYRPGPDERPTLDGDPRFDDSLHEIDPGATPVDAEGRPLVDPYTGEPLEVDTEGNVKYGDEWVDPETAAKNAALDATHNAEVEQGKQLVDEFKDLRSQLDAETDPAERERLEAEIRDKAIEINGDYQAKAALKQSGRSPDAAAYDDAIHEVYEDVYSQHADTLNDRGMKIGGREFDSSDMKEFRNAASKGTTGMDNDYGLDESKVTDLETRLHEATPGSKEAAELSSQLRDARKAQEVTVDYDKLLEATRRDLANAEPDSPRHQELTDRLNKYETDASRHKENYISELNQRLNETPPGTPEHDALRAELDAAATRSAGRAETPVSKNTWNDLATDAYRDSYHEVTNSDPEAAFQSVTSRTGTPESYGDPNVLAGKPGEQPFDPARAEQTASVTQHKVTEMAKLAEAGKISDATAVQESARGTAKDVAGKLLTTLENDPRADPAKVQVLKDINDVLTRAGTGEIPPGRVDSELRKVVPGDPNMNLDKATKIMESNLEAAIKFQPGEGEAAPRAGDPTRPGGPEVDPRLSHGFQVASDLAAFDANRQALIDKGMGSGEATLVAAAQTHAGNAALASGVADPRVSMAGGALLPRGVDNVLPDRAVENYVATGYEGGKAALDSLNTSMKTGRIDTTALDKFADGVANRPGADPFKGYAEMAKLAGSESARTDGGNLFTDVKQVIQSGAGAEVANQSMSEFQADVAAGKHGAALQGLDHIIRIGTELGVDPKGTVGEFVEDVKTIYANGVGKGYWGEAGKHTVDVLHEVPVVGHVMKGYEEIGGAARDIYQGVSEKGVVGFAKGAASDTAQVAGYVYDETKTSITNGASYVANSASNFGSWVKSFF